MTDVPFFDPTNYLPLSILKAAIRSKSQFWTVLYTRGFGCFHPRVLLSPLPTTPDVHPVNYFVSGYLQRAVNSCRADYTDRFIALVSQSNVRNAPPPATTLARCFSGLPEFPDSPSFLLASFRSDFDRSCSKRATIFFFSARKTYATSLISIKNKYNTNVI